MARIHGGEAELTGELVGEGGEAIPQCYVRRCSGGFSGEATPGRLLQMRKLGGGSRCKGLRGGEKAEMVRGGRRASPAPLFIGEAW